MPVALGELRHTWATIRDRLQAMSDRYNEPWIAADVFHEILVGNSQLWALEDHSGFVVTRLFASAYERTLHVWIAHNDSEAKIAAYWPQILAIAETNDCARVTWESPREGYVRALPNVQRRYSYSIQVGGTP